VRSHPLVQEQLPRHGDVQQRHQPNDNYVFQFKNRLEWFAESRSLGEHNFAIQDQFLSDTQTNKLSVPGDQVIEYNGVDPQRTTFTYSNGCRSSRRQ